MWNNFNLHIGFKGVAKRIIMGFAAMIIAFALSVLVVFEIVNDSSATLNRLFEEHDPAVEQLYELRRIVTSTKLNIINVVYLPKDETAVKNLHRCHQYEFPVVKNILLKSVKKWSSHIERQRTIDNLHLFEENIKFQRSLLLLLPNFESHNNPMLMFESEDLLELSIIPVLDKIEIDVQKTLDWEKSEKAKARKSMEKAYALMVNILLLIGLIMTVLGIVATQITTKKIVVPLKKIQDLIFRLSKGELVNGNKSATDDEIGAINSSINTLIESMKYNARFAESIGEGMFDLEYTPLSEKDELGFSLKEMNVQIKTLIESLQKTQAQTLVAKVKAEEALVAKSQFLSVMSHEIRTPLNAILGMSNLLNDAKLTEDQLDYLTTIQFSAKSLYHLINEILDISKLDAGKVSLEDTAFDLKQQINHIVKLHEDAVKNKNLTLKLVTNLESNVYYRGDSFRINQVLNNLINNAIKFTENGGLLLEANIVEDSLESDCVTFKVTDTGIGIAASKLGYVFESFTQADSNTTRLYGGTGLGLSICKKLVVLMGSDILLSSEAGKGSCFSFTLKLPKTNAAQPTMLSENAAEDTAALVDKKILVVEDNGINAKLMMAFLKKNGMVPTVAENGLIGVEKAISTSYDLILMDLQMPVMDGYEATKRIKALKPQLPIIALSAEALQDVKALLDEFGFEDYVSKPFDPKVLLSKLAYFTSAHFQPSVHEHNQSHIVSFFRYIEMANNDHVFLELILTQVVEEFQVLKALLLADNDTIILDQVSLEKCVLKLSPSIKMFTLSDLLLKLELFLSFQTSEAIDQSGLKPLLIETIDTVIEEINTKIIAIKS